MFTLFGDCEKHDFAIALSMCLSALTEKEVTIISDSNKNYKYFEGEVSGVKIGPETRSSSDIVIYDCHNTILSDIGEDNKLIAFTDFSKASIDQIIGLQRSVIPSGLVVIEEESHFSPKYIDLYLGTDYGIYSYPYSSKRKIDIVFDGVVSFKKLDQDFIMCLGKFLEDFVGVANKDLRSLWNYLRRRG